MESNSIFFHNIRKALLPRPPRDENASAREDRGPRQKRRDDRK
jgi:polyribonucleotide nucleotidyltransferase